MSDIKITGPCGCKMDITEKAAKLMFPTWPFMPATFFCAKCGVHGCSVGEAEPARGFTKTDFKPSAEQETEGILANPPTIEQEIEAGLKNLPNNTYYSTFSRPCTFILLPEDKFREYVAWQTRDYDGSKPMKRKIVDDIPVYSYSGKDIHYCTD